MPAVTSGKSCYNISHGKLPHRAAKLIRLHMIDRLDRLTVESGRLERIAAEFGIPPDRVVDLLYLIQVTLFPEEFEEDAEVSRVIGVVTAGLLTDRPRRVSRRLLAAAASAIVS